MTIQNLLKLQKYYILSFNRLFFMKIKVSEKNKELLDKYTSEELMGFVDDVKDDLCKLDEPVKEYMDYEISDELYEKLVLYSSHNSESLDNTISRLFVLKDLLDVCDTDIYVKGYRKGFIN